MKFTAILDIGSSKAVCLIGSNAARGNTLLRGYGIAAYPGYEESVFKDEKALESAIISAVKDAEEKAQYRIREIAIGVPATFSKLILSTASIRLGDEKRRVTDADIDELLDLSLEKAEAPGYRLMHSTPALFTVDGVEAPDTPVDRKATELGITASHVYMSDYYYSTLTRILRNLAIEVTLSVSTPLAESLLLIPEEERMRPAILIDVGYLNTDICLVENTALTNLTTLDIGGAQFASDLAFGLDIPLEFAEQTKRKYSFLQDEESEIATIHMPTGVKRVRREVIDLIMEARAAEFSDLVLKSLEQMGTRPETKPVTYLTGGGFSMMRGGGEYLRQTLGLRVKRDAPYFPVLQTPNYSSAFGVLDFVLRNLSDEGEFIDDEAPKRGIVKRFKNLFSK